MCKTLSVVDTEILLRKHKDRDTFEQTQIILRDRNTNTDTFEKNTNTDTFERTQIFSYELLQYKMLIRSLGCGGGCFLNISVSVLTCFYTILSVLYILSLSLLVLSLLSLSLLSLSDPRPVGFSYICYCRESPNQVRVFLQYFKVI